MIVGCSIVKGCAVMRSLFCLSVVAISARGEPMRCPWCVYVAIGSQSCPWRADALPVAVYVAIGSQSCPWRADALPVVRICGHR